MKSINERLQEKLNAYEYPYNQGAWESFQRKLKIRKAWKWGGITMATMAVIATSIFVLNHTPQDTNRRTNTSKQPIEQLNSKILQAQKPASQENITTHFHNASKVSETNNNKTIVFDNTNNQTKNFENNSNSSELVNNNNVNITNTSVNLTFNKSVSQGCAPLDVKFTANVNVKIAECIWDFGDGSFSYELNTHHEYKKGGKYKVNLKVKTTDGQVFNSESQIVQVWYAPKALFEYSSNENCIYLKNISKQSTFLNWYINDSLINEETTHICYRKSGKVSISLLVENNEGCIDSANKTIDIIYKMPVKFADAFTPDGDGINDLFGPQIIDEDEYNFKMFIYNKVGKCVYEANGNQVRWDGNNVYTKQPCPADAYFYKVLAVDKLGNKNEFSGKIQLIR